MTNPDWNPDTPKSSILIHHCRSNDCDLDLISLKYGERDYPDVTMIVLRRMSCLFAVSQDSIQRRVRMSVHNPPRLVNLAAIGLLRDEPLAISTLEFLPTELYPPLFMAAVFGRRRETLKAMVPAWPFARLPLGGLMQKPHQRTLQAVLEGLDVLLAQKVHPR